MIPDCPEPIWHVLPRVRKRATWRHVHLMNDAVLAYGWDRKVSNYDDYDERFIHWIFVDRGNERTRREPSQNETREFFASERKATYLSPEEAEALYESLKVALSDDP